MKRTLLVLLAIALIAPVSLADPPAETGIVIRGEYYPNFGLWGETGPMLWIGMTAEDLTYFCRNECQESGGEMECPRATTQWQSVLNDGWNTHYSQEMAYASLWPNPKELGMDFCEVMATFSPYGEGFGNFTINWNGTVCPETEVWTWRAQGYITTNGDNPVTLNFNARWHCVDVCDDEPIQCTDEIVKLTKDVGD